MYKAEWLYTVAVKCCTTVVQSGECEKCRDKYININIYVSWLIIPFLSVINIFSETDCKENLIVFIVIVNVTIMRRPWSSSISAHVLVSWYYLSLILVGRCPIFFTLIICIRSCIDYHQGVFLLRPPLT